MPAVTSIYTIPALRIAHKSCITPLCTFAGWKTMKFIGKLLVYLLVALLIVILALYILLQTRWGAAQVSSWVTVNTDYELSFDKMNHRFSSPSHLILENVTFGRDGKPATLVAKKVDIGLSSRQVTDPLHMDAITLSMAR